MFVNSDFSDLLRLFNTNQVKYLVIGGYALIQYAEPRYTKDPDLWISADATNAIAVYVWRWTSMGCWCRSLPGKTSSRPNVRQGVPKTYWMLNS